MLLHLMNILIYVNVALKSDCKEQFSYLPYCYIGLDELVYV